MCEVIFVIQTSLHAQACENKNIFNKLYPLLGRPHKLISVDGYC